MTHTINQQQQQKGLMHQSITFFFHRKFANYYMLYFYKLDLPKYWDGKKNVSSNKEK